MASAELPDGLRRVLKLSHGVRAYSLVALVVVVAIASVVAFHAAKEEILTVSPENQPP